MAAEALHPDEYVYRRVAYNHYRDPKSEPLPMIEAFRPTKNDTDGISLSRANCTSIENVAIGHSDKRYHVARMRVRDLHGVGVSVIADDPQNNPSHAIIPELSLAAYNESKPACKKLANKIIVSTVEMVLVALDPDEFPDQSPASP